MTSSPHVGSYATSGALSTAHYRLVQSVQASNDVTETNALLVDCLEGIRKRWSKKAPSPSKARHDLVLLLYCREQRFFSMTLSVEQRELFGGGWALPTAVMLAGGGGGGMSERVLGFRACSELFPVDSHPLKLLLINTIRSDLYAASGSSKAEARIVLALRAIAERTLVSSELIPAVRERVFELLTTLGVSDPARRLALAALLSLVRAAQLFTTVEEPASILAEARHAVLALLLPPPPSVASSSSGRRHRSRHSSPLPLPLLAAISSALSTSSPLHPVLPLSSDRLRLQLSILQMILAASEEEKRLSRYKGVGGGWALSTVLNALRAELVTARASEGGVNAPEGAVALLGQTVEALLKVGSDFSNALVVSALRVLHLLPFITPDPAFLPPLLRHVHSSLLHPPSPASSLFALRALTLLPPSTWAVPPSASSSSPLYTDAEWGEPAWRTLLGGVDHPDSAIRRATFALLAQVDSSLVKMHYERLLKSTALPSSSTAASNSSVGDGGGSGRKTTTRRRMIPLLLEVLPYLPTSSSTTSSSSTTPAPSVDPLVPPSLPPPSALLQLFAAPELALKPTNVLPEIVLPILDAFRYEEDAEKRRRFAKELFEGGGDGASWKTSATVGLLVAGTVHALTSVVRDAEAEKAVADLAEWLSRSDGSSSADLTSLLQEPYIFAILRLISLSPSSSSSKIKSIRTSLARAAHLADSQTMLIAEVLADDVAGRQHLATLRRIGEASKEKTLAEFSEQLLADFDSPFSALPPPSQSSRSSQQQPQHPSHHQQTSAPPPQPLRYTPYSSSISSPTASSPSSPFISLPIPSHDPAPFSPPSVSSSAAACAREQRELQRERADRGGAGSQGGAAKSLMGAGELALLAEGLGLEEKEEERESMVDELEERTGTKQSARTSNALGLETAPNPWETGGGDGVLPEGGKDGFVGESTERDLLFDDNIEHSLDPFHSG